MDAQAIEMFLGCLGAKSVKTTGHGWITAPCPLAPWRHESGKDSNPSFGVKLESGLPHVHCFSCGVGGDLHDLIIEMQVSASADELSGCDFKTAFVLIEQAETEAVPVDMASKFAARWEQQEVKSKLVEFPEDWLESFQPAYGADWPAGVHPYLVEREVSPEVAELMDLRFDSYRERIGFPIRDAQGVLRGMQGRTVLPGHQPRYFHYEYKGQRNGHWMLGEHLVDHARPVCVPESVFDLARVFHVYRNAASPLTATVSRLHIKKLQGFPLVITMFDLGAAGDAGRLKVQEGLSDSFVVHVRPPEQFGDFGATPAEAIKWLLQKYIPQLAAAA